MRLEINPKQHLPDAMEAGQALLRPDAMTLWSRWRAYLARPRVNRLTIASRRIAPTSETRKLATLRP